MQLDTQKVSYKSRISVSRIISALNCNFFYPNFIFSSRKFIQKSCFLSRAKSDKKYYWIVRQVCYICSGYTWDFLQFDRVYPERMMKLNFAVNDHQCSKKFWNIIPCPSKNNLCRIPKVRIWQDGMSDIFCCTNWTYLPVQWPKTDEITKAQKIVVELSFVSFFKLSLSERRQGEKGALLEA